MSTPHSKTVRGTLSNEKTKAAISTNEKPAQIGDPVSFVTDTSNKSADSAPSAPSTFDQKTYQANPKDLSHNETSPKRDAAEDNLPHSKKVRGTLANKSGKSVNKTMLGDPASLKSETSQTRLDRDVESGVGGEGGKSTYGKSKL